MAKTAPTDTAESTTTDTPTDSPTPPAVHPAPGGLTLAQVGGLLSGAALGPGDQPGGERELILVADELRREGAQLPAEYIDAMNLLGRFDTLRSPHATGVPADALRRASLDQLDVWTLDQVVNNTTLHALRQTHDNGVTNQVRAALLDRARNALAAELPALLAALAPDFRRALADVQTAVAAGITADTTPADIIDNDDAIAAWRALVAPESGVGRLTRLWRLRCRAIRVVGCHVPPEPGMAALQPGAPAMVGVPAQDYDVPALRGAVPDGWGRAGRDAWLSVLAAGVDVVAELTDPHLVAARIDDRTGRSTVPADAPDKWELERASILARPEPEPIVPPASSTLANF
ncbi:hypothetical protein [Actinomycetospora soli]|uniref:hypothetical protein n=1 Tax=Actinomycetospora soli TaxID=2893887 RepID=UPI001E37A783|nr:hypothetical protein [Actinomycetospora soli]MCD2191676.1 hypothetical protein [Actinomycetospora soli]